MKLYSIADWEQHYENNRTRELKVMSWVPVTNKLDGDGYTELISHPNGAALYGAWIACVHVASKCDPRGTLLRSSRTPHDAASLSRITRIPPTIITTMLEVTEKIGWMTSTESELQSKNEIPQEGAGIPQEGATVPRLARARGQEGKGKEQKGKEQKEGGFSKSELPDWIVIPPELSSPEFRETLTSLFAYRKERRFPAYQKTSLSLKFAEFLEWGEAAAIQAMKTTISNQWQGIFPPKPEQKNGNHTRQSEATRDEARTGIKHVPIKLKEFGPAATGNH